MSILPTQRRADLPHPARLRAVLYGRPGCGKTSFVASFPGNPAGCCILDLEGGAKFINAARVPVRTWRELTGAIAEFAGGGHGYDAVAIDTVDKMRDLAIAQFLDGNQPRNVKDWGMVNGAIRQCISILSASGYGAWYLSHEEVVTCRPDGTEIKLGEDYRGPKIERTEPSVGGAVWRAIEGDCDAIIRMEVGPRGERRLVSAGEGILCKSRTELLPKQCPATWADFAAPFRAAWDAAKAAQVAEGKQ